MSDEPTTGPKAPDELWGLWSPAGQQWASQDYPVVTTFGSREAADCGKMHQGAYDDFAAHIVGVSPARLAEAEARTAKAETELAATATVLRRLRERNKEADEAVEQLQAELNATKAEVERLRIALAHKEEAIVQRLGKALGFPWFKDDQKNFPGATDADGIVSCFAAEEMAILAVEEIERLRSRILAMDFNL